ncbi:MAG: hypothetical protein U5K54_13865 [Cytophagales bacterium]|nr:hypothetical protein [Cytophagales bacterium]
MDRKKLGGVTSRVPDFMYRVNFANAQIQGVDYWEDDFDYYLRNKRPEYLVSTRTVKNLYS